MIYFDNAATTYPKPPEVIKTMSRATVRYGANPGRGGHKMSYLTSEAVYGTRKRVAEFFGTDAPENVIFTKNCTEALNIVIKGLCVPGCRFICSSLDHNAVIRPLEALRRSGTADYDIAPVGKTDDETVANFKRLLRSNTRAVICTGASNVFGERLPTAKLARLAHENGTLFILDAAQTAGIVNIDMRRDEIDFLCTAGHKGLYGPMGTGLLVINSDEHLNSLIEGGTGSFSAVLSQPEIYPDRFESGTLNVPGILSLGEGIRFVSDRGVSRIYKSEQGHIADIYKALKNIPNVRLYTDPFSSEKSYVPLLSFNVDGLHSEQTAALLANDNIAVRAGLHCAPSAHKTYGTLREGTVRIAPSIFTKKQDVNLLLTSVVKIAKNS